MENRLTQKLRDLDAFPKIDSSYMCRTSAGGLTTVLICCFLAWLTYTEVVLYLKPQRLNFFFVDQEISDHIFLDIDMEVASPCQDLVVMQIDSMEQILVVDAETLSLTPVVFGARNDKLLQRIKSSLSDLSKVKNGCRLHGQVQLHKTAGKVIISPRVRTLGFFLQYIDDNLNFSHIIYKFSFGKPYSGSVNPLENSTEVAMRRMHEFQYNILLIPTAYQTLGGWGFSTYQYAVMDFDKDASAVGSIPGIYFNFDIEPISVRVMDGRPSFASFLTRTIGIVAGIFTCAGILHRIAAWSLDSDLGRRFNFARSMYKPLPQSPLVAAPLPLSSPSASATAVSTPFISPLGSPSAALASPITIHDEPFPLSPSPSLSFSEGSQKAMRGKQF